MTLPARGLDTDAIFTALEGLRAADVPWREGRTWAYVYDPGAAAEAVIKRAYTMYLSENGLDPTAFPSVLALENQLVAIGAAHLRGGAGVVGNFTSGGTESIMLAVKSARDYARSVRGIERPAMIIPETAHAAFHKAASYLGVELRVTQVDPRTFKADVQAMRDAIDDRTALLVGSAVSYAHCVVDPIPEIAALAAERGLLCHVDGCMGGFLLPYFRRLGAPVTEFDFTVAGVTSISMDLHKYAFAAKGASLILYRSAEVRRHQIFACAGWTGYTMVNATVQSSKSAGPMAAAWAVLHHFGDEGYLKIAEGLLGATRRICAGIAEIPGLSLVGEPEMNLIAFTSSEADVFHIADEMKARGWYVQPQLAYNTSPANIHLSVNPKSVPLVEALLADLRASVDAARELPVSPLVAMVGQLFAGMDPGQGIEPGVLRQMREMGGLRDGALPERMAEVNQVLNALPAVVREMLLVEFMNDLYRPGGVDTAG